MQRLFASLLAPLGWTLSTLLAYFVSILMVSIPIGLTLRRLQTRAQHRALAEEVGVQLLERQEEEEEEKKTVPLEEKTPTIEEDPTKLNEFSTNPKERHIRFQKRKELMLEEARRLAKYLKSFFLFFF
jgi:hypothetical protein